MTLECASSFFDHQHEVHKARSSVDYEIGVGRNSLCEQKWNSVLVPEDQSEKPFPSVMQSLPLPRTVGSIDMMVACLRAAPSSSRLRIAVPDLNIVHFLNDFSTSEIDDAHLLRLRSQIQAIGRTPQAVLSADYGRLRLTAGEAAAKARVSAVESSALYFYPSTHPTRADSWEVRFLQADDTNPDEAACTYERFLDWGEQEVLRYIDLAIKLGNADRLQPRRLALEDPGMFWQICFRFVECFPKLAKEGGQREWEEKLEEGLATAIKETAQSMCGKTAQSMPSFGRKMEKAVLRGGRTVLSDLAEMGSAYGMQRVVECAPKNVKLRLEMDEEVKAAPAGKFFSEMQGRIANPAASFAEDVKKAGLGVGKRVVIEGLVKASHFNGQRGTIRGLEAASLRLQVELEDGGQTLKVKLCNVRDEASGAQGTEVGLIGACKVCAGCKKTESAPGIFKSCSSCRSVYYCGKACQTQDWKVGGHKLVCGKTGAALREAAGVVQVVVLPAGNDGHPYAKSVRGGSFDEQMQQICAELLDCRTPNAVASTKIQRGEGPDLVGVLLFYNAAATEAGAARGNARASGLTVPPGTMLQFDGRGELGAIRGDAVLLRMACDNLGGGNYTVCQPQRLEHFELDTYVRNLGSFQMLQIPSTGVLTSFFAKTPEGEAEQTEFFKMLHNRQAGGLKLRGMRTGRGR